MDHTLDELLEHYADDHRHPWNRALHLVSIPMITISLALVVFSPPLGIALLGLGWFLQFLGHAIEGKPPTFSKHPRYMAVGALWYVREVRALARRWLGASAR